MKIVKLSEPWNGLDTGDVVVCDNVNAGEILVRQMNAEIVFQKPPDQNWRGGETLVVRAGGIGDIIQSGPLVRQLAKTDRVTFCAARPFAEVAAALPGVAKVELYPLALADVLKFDSVIYLENVVETARRVHIADAFLAAGGFDPATIDPADKAPQIKVPRAPYKFKKHKPRVGFQVDASAKCRSPSAAAMSRIASTFARQGWELMFFGSPGSVENDDAGVINLTAFKRPPTIMQSAAIMQSCDVFIAPDSGLLHLAAAAGVPSVGLFSVIDAKSRTAYSPYQIGIEGQAPCAPCFWHNRTGHFPPDCPSKEKGVCYVLESIKPDLVYDCALAAIKSKQIKKGDA